MATFQYKAKTKDAQTVAGQVIADNREDAVEKVNQMGLTPVSVAEGGKTGKGRAARLKGKIRHKDVYRFSRQLVSLLRAGVPILKALDAIGAQIGKASFKVVIEAIHSGIRGGRSFSDCLAEYPQIFTGLYVTMVRAGEESGRLKEAVGSIAQYLEHQNEVASRVRSALAYPVFMTLFGFGTLFFILTYVMPQIMGLYVHLDQTLPTITVVVMTVSSFLVRWWAVVLLGIVIVTGAIHQWSKTPAGRVSLSRFVIALPWLGMFLMKIELARFSRTLELLMKSGVSIVRSMQLAIPIVRNELLREQLTKCQDELLAGRSFGESLAQAKEIPAMMGQMIRVGEESGALGPTFEEIAQNYEMETNESIKVMMTLLEPVLILTVGAVIGLIVVAMLMPIFELDVFSG